MPSYGQRSARAGLLHSYSLSQIFSSSFKFALKLCKIFTTFYYYKTLTKKRKVSGLFSTKYFPSDFYCYGIVPA